MKLDLPCKSCGIGPCGVPRPSLAGYVAATAHQERGNRRRRVPVLAIFILFSLALVLTIQVWLMVLFLVYAAIHAVVRPGTRRCPRALKSSTCSSEPVPLHDVSPMVRSGGAPSPPIAD
jgi:hypothetical protein